MRKFGAASLAALVSLVAWAGQASAAFSSPDTVRVLIVYHSETGNTQTLAEAAAEGARSLGGRRGEYEDRRRGHERGSRSV